MSATKNHQKAIRAIIEAHRTPGKMREIMLTILADKPSAIVNAWEEVKPEPDKMPKCKECGEEVDYSGEEKCFRCWSKISS